MQRLTPHCIRRWGKRAECAGVAAEVPALPPWGYPPATCPTCHLPIRVTHNGMPMLETRDFGWVKVESFASKP